MNVEVLAGFIATILNTTHQRKYTNVGTPKNTLSAVSKNLEQKIIRSYFICKLIAK